MPASWPGQHPSRETELGSFPTAWETIRDRKPKHLAQAGTKVPARHGYFFCFTLLPKLAFLSGQICPKVLNQDFTFLEKTLESPLDCGVIQPVHPRRNQPRIFIGRTDAEAEGPVLCPPDVKSQLI